MINIDEAAVCFKKGVLTGPFTEVFGFGIHWIIGPNGIGKSTLLKLICGALIPDRGTITVFGKNPTTDHKIRSKIGYVSAVPDLPGFLTVNEAWQLASAFRKRPTWKGNKIAQELNLPNIRLDQASVGQRHKAEILASLAGDPSVLLLDEPYTGLDKPSIEVINKLLETFRKDRIIIIASHEDLGIRPCSIRYLVQKPT